MIVATEARVGDDGTACMPIPPAVLPFILRCPDDDASVLARLDRLAAP